MLYHLFRERKLNNPNCMYQAQFNVDDFFQEGCTPFSFLFSWTVKNGWLDTDKPETEWSDRRPVQSILRIDGLVELKLYPSNNQKRNEYIEKMLTIMDIFYFFAED